MRDERYKRDALTRGWWGNPWVTWHEMLMYTCTRVIMWRSRALAAEARARGLETQADLAMESAHDWHHDWRDERDERIRLEERLKVFEAQREGGAE